MGFFNKYTVGTGMVLGGSLAAGIYAASTSPGSDTQKVNEGIIGAGLGAAGVGTGLLGMTAISAQGKNLFNKARGIRPPKWGEWPMPGEALKSGLKGAKIGAKGILGLGATVGLTGAALYGIGSMITSQDTPSDYTQSLFNAGLSSTQSEPYSSDMENAYAVRAQQNLEQSTSGLVQAVHRKRH